MRLRRNLVVIGLILSLFSTLAGIAGAENLAIDGDTLVGNANVNSAVVIDTATECNDGASIPAAAVVSWSSGNTHYNSGTTVTVTFTPDAAAISAGITVTTGSVAQTIGSPWVDPSSKTYNTTTTVPGGLDDDTYTVAVKAVGAATKHAGTRNEESIPAHELTGFFHVHIRCDQFDTAGPTPNTTPTVSIADEYFGSEGSPIEMTTVTVTDESTPTLTYLWSYTTTTVDSGATCAFSSATVMNPTLTCTDDGEYGVTLTVTDNGNKSASDTAAVYVGNVDPDITSALSVAQPAACQAQVNPASFADAGSNDTHTAEVDWGDGTTSTVAISTPTATGINGVGWTSTSTVHTYSTTGTLTILLTVFDDDLGSDTTGTSFTTKNTPSAFLAPINSGAGVQKSVFKLGSTIPVKITVTDCANNAVTTLTPVVQLQKVDNVPDGTVNEPQIIEAPTNGKQMRWLETHYQYNLSTKRSQFCTNSAITGCNGGDLTAGTYKLSVTDSTFFGPTVAYFDLR